RQWPGETGQQGCPDLVRRQAEEEISEDAEDVTDPGCDQDVRRSHPVHSASCSCLYSSLLAVPLAELVLLVRRTSCPCVSSCLSKLTGQCLGEPTTTYRRFTG